ncbi:hypothetical protein ABC304_12265 [Microbacterium sp. 1P10UB]|uniref:hypothetical protein n=1 Tax=unclassified Microbacterium TaxID=2609290 RepID=UPI0039A10D82
MTGSPAHRGRGEASVGSLSEVVAVGMMLPNELVWIMEKLGFEWPDVDEDEVRKGATLVRNLGTDLESVIQAVDTKVNGDLAGALIEFVRNNAGVDLIDSSRNVVLR